MPDRGFKIRACPSCGGRQIKAKRGTWRGEHDGKSYTVPGVRFFECPACGEKAYPPEAMRRIQECSPAYAKRARRSASRGPTSRWSGPA
ncbi:MAG: YgiT-type zinc finger protein [Candidatus Binatia bacterium]